MKFIPILIIISVLFFSGCTKEDIELVNEYITDIQKEEKSTNNICTLNCDDGNPCTKEVCNEETNYECKSIPLNQSVEGCSGNINSCQYFSCVDGECKKITLNNCSTELDYFPEIEINKSEKPQARVFIMPSSGSIQFLKAYIPVIELLKDKTELYINFNYYAFGSDKIKDIDESSRMYCIREGYNDKFIPYLKCFVEDGNSTRCLENVSLTNEMIKNCYINVQNNYVNESEILTYFNVDKELNEKYNITGHPIFILNEKKISPERSANSIKRTICAAFIEPPVECLTVLKTEIEKGGFGY